MNVVVGMPVVDGLGFVGQQVQDFEKLVPGVRILAVDNGSSDGSGEFLAGHPVVQVIPNQANVGFSCAANQLLSGAGMLGADYLLLHNTDAFFTNDFVQPMVELAEETGAGIVGPKVLDAIDNNQRGSAYTIQCAGDVLLPQPKNHWMAKDVEVGDFIVEDSVPAFKLHTTPRVGHEASNDWVEPQEVQFYTFVSVLIRLEMIAQIGPLNEGLVNYGSDTELCLRAREAGWSIWYQSQSRVWHVGGGSSHAQYTEQTVADFLTLDEIMSRARVQRML